MIMRKRPLFNKGAFLFPKNRQITCRSLLTIFPINLTAIHLPGLIERLGHGSDIILHGDRDQGSKLGIIGHGRVRLSLCLTF